MLAAFGEESVEPPALPGEGLADRLAAALERLGPPPPGPVVVQGDTLSTLAGALWAFYADRPVIHLEAGLRTPRVDRPFPEEAHRRLVARLSSLHIAPTSGARDALVLEGCPASDVVVAGNTVVDALGAFRGREADAPRPWLDAPRRVLMTCHRRENAEARPALLERVASWAAESGGDCVLFVGHPSHAAGEAPPDGPGFLARGPVDYPGMLALVGSATLVLTDSGGLQEEAPALGAPVAVLREETERVEGLGAGVARLAPPSSLPAALPGLLAWADGRDREPAFPYGEPGAAGRAAVAIIGRYPPGPP